MSTIFKIETPNTEPIFIFSKYGWVGLIQIVDKISKQECTMISPISFWQFVKEWMKR